MTKAKLFQVDFAYMLDVDSLGFNVKVTLKACVYLCQFFGEVLQTQPMSYSDTA